MNITFQNNKKKHSVSSKVIKNLLYNVKSEYLYPGSSFMYKLTIHFLNFPLDNLVE